MRVLLLQTLVFLSSFLIFQIELILGKSILPGFGGGYMVWGITLVFYQALLFIGYGYVHLMNGRLLFTRFRMIHTYLVALSLLLLPINVDRMAEPSYQWPMVGEIVFLLTLTIGGLFFVLSTLSVYLQVHLSDSYLEARKNPYVLFAGSNLGAFAALLSYPFFWEPYFDLSEQTRAWEFAYALVVVLFIAIQLLIPIKKQDKPTGISLPSVPNSQLLKWLLLSAAPSAFFLAVTNELTLNIAPVPLLWILPLAVYLLTLVLSFKKNPFCPKWFLDYIQWFIALGIILFFFNMMGQSLMELGHNTVANWFPEHQMLARSVGPVLMLSLCFVFCLACHFRLNQAKPEDPGGLTAYYMVLSAGGFVGGFVVNWVAPWVFNLTLETLISFALGAWGLALGQKELEGKKSIFVFKFLAILGVTLMWPVLRKSIAPEGRFLVDMGSAMALLILFASLGTRLKQHAVVLAGLVVWVVVLDANFVQKQLVFKTRNHYGVHTVHEFNGFRMMKHGTTMHGAQILDPRGKNIPLTYFHPGSPMGLLLTQRQLPMQRVALMGLGAGSLAGYAKEGDEWEYFEIDPMVGYIAQNYFSFLKDNPGKVDIVYGDARVTMRKQPDQTYDAVVIDVFNSDAIPVHLLTVEAMKEYDRALKKGGVIFFHVSNRFMNLLPVIYSNAEALGWHFSFKLNPEAKPPLKAATIWGALTKYPESHEILKKEQRWLSGKIKQKIRPWTDQYSSIWPVLNQ